MDDNNQEFSFEIKHFIIQNNAFLNTLCMHMWEVLTFTMNKDDIMYKTGIFVVQNLGTVEKLLGAEKGSEKGEGLVVFFLTGDTIVWLFGDLFVHVLNVFFILVFFFNIVNS